VTSCRGGSSRTSAETEASVIRSYEVQFVQGLLQAEDYARAVILISNAHAPAEEIDRRVSLRMRRQGTADPARRAGVLGRAGRSGAAPVPGGRR